MICKTYIKYSTIQVFTISKDVGIIYRSYTGVPRKVYMLIVMPRQPLNLLSVCCSPNKDIWKGKRCYISPYTQKSNKLADENLSHEDLLV